MTGTEEFEDRFNHTPGTAYEEEEIDLGPDDEFAGSRRSKNAVRTEPKKRFKKMRSPSGCMIRLSLLILKAAVSIGLITLACLYIFNPEKLGPLQKYLPARTVSEKQKAKPVPEIPLPSGRGMIAPPAEPVPVQPAVQAEPEPAPVPERTASPQRPQEPVADPLLMELPELNLRGAGSIPDFITASARNPSLRIYVTRANGLRFGNLDGFRNMIDSLIYDWTGAPDDAALEEMAGMPFSEFYDRTAFHILSRTVLVQAGLTPSGDENLIEEKPVQVMAAVYPLLKSAISNKQTVRAQLKTVEPVSSFLLHFCNNEIECLASWDLLIDMLGLKQYSQILERTPDKIYETQAAE